jgi:hypothetical protein
MTLLVMNGTRSINKNERTLLVMTMSVILDNNSESRGTNESEWCFRGRVLANWSRVGCPPARDCGKQTCQNFRAICEASVSTSKSATFWVSMLDQSCEVED